MSHPYSEEDEKMDRECNATAGVIVGVWVFLVVVRPLLYWMWL